jgi:hypothetical protein
MAVTAACKGVGGQLTLEFRFAFGKWCSGL